MKLIGCEAMEGPVYINPLQIAYFRDLYGNPDHQKIEVFTCSQRDSRIVIEGRARDFAKALGEISYE